VGDPPTAGRERAIQAIVREGLAAGHTFRPRVISGSMSPFICIDDRVQVRPVELGALRPGDIVVLASPDGALVTHRYIHFSQEGDEVQLLTKGDRPLALDSPWPAAALVGRVEAIDRGNRQLPIHWGWGRRMHRLLAILTLWEWRLISHLPGRLARRVFHKGVGWLARFIAALAWSQSIPSPD